MGNLNSQFGKPVKPVKSTKLNKSNPVKKPKSNPVKKLNSNPAKKPKSKKPKSKCQQYLNQKIATNINEFKFNKTFISREQAIAAAYNQVKREHPQCRRFLEKKVLK